MPFLGPKW